jgi:plasmid maintenance system killer protein
MRKVLGKRIGSQLKILSASKQINKLSIFQKNHFLAYAVDGATKGKHH